MTLTLQGVEFCIFIYLFLFFSISFSFICIWLCQVLVTAQGIFDFVGAFGIFLVVACELSVAACRS